MVDANRSASVLRLGQKIVDELGLDQTVDTLGRWMAHFVAEKIVDAEAATGEDRPQKMSICADAILKLWAHRSALPNGKRPLEDFEPIFHTLQSLDPDDETPRYFRQARSAIADEDEAVETKKWLDTASGLDYTARILIRYCLTAAAENAVDKSREWVALASEATAKDDIDIEIVRIVVNDTDALNAKSPDDLQRDRMRDLLKRLNVFRKLAGDLSKHLRQIVNPS